MEKFVMYDVRTAICKTLVTYQHFFFTDQMRSIQKITEGM